MQMGRFAVAAVGLLVQRPVFISYFIARPLLLLTGNDFSVACMVEVFAVPSAFEFQATSPANSPRCGLLLQMSQLRGLFVCVSGMRAMQKRMNRSWAGLGDKTITYAPGIMY